MLKKKESKEWKSFLSLITQYEFAPHFLSHSAFSQKWGFGGGCFGVFSCLLVFSNSKFWAKEVKSREDFDKTSESEPCLHACASPLPPQGSSRLLRSVPAAPFPCLLTFGMTAPAGGRTLGENGRCLGPRGQAPSTCGVLLGS